MPFRIDKVKKAQFRIYNLEKRKYTKPTFKSRKSALNMKKVWEKFDNLKYNK